MEIWGEGNAGLEEGMVFLFLFLFFYKTFLIGQDGLGLYT